MASKKLIVGAGLLSAPTLHQRLKDMETHTFPVGGLGSAQISSANYVTELTEDIKKIVGEDNIKDFIQAIQMVTATKRYSYATMLNHSLDLLQDRATQEEVLTTLKAL